MSSDLTRFRPHSAPSSHLLYVYETLSHGENLTSLDEDTIIPMFLHLLFSCGGLNRPQIKEKFVSIDFDFIDQPADLVQEGAYDWVHPYLFLYIASMIPKNPSESLMKFQKNKEKGLINSLKIKGYEPEPLSFQVKSDVLASLQNIVNYHSDLLSYTFDIFLGFCNPNARTSVYPYAYELVGQVQYANMTSVQMIEDYLLVPKHPCLADMHVSGSLGEYNKFKKEAQSYYHDAWIYVALLNKELWTKFSRSRAHKRLRIISCMFAAEEIPTFENIIVDGTTISTFKAEPYYKDIFDAYCTKAQGLVQGQSQYLVESEVDSVRRNAQKWTTRTAL